MGQQAKGWVITFHTDRGRRLVKIGPVTLGLENRWFKEPPGEAKRTCS